MRQALHIFKKDVRHLWFEIAVAMTVVTAFTFKGARRALWLVDPVTNRTAAWTMVLILLPLAWWTLIARVIHDEALTGDRQFWITRPYSWKSLLGAKALFILTFINLPMLFADVVILRAYGLRPLGAELPGLLWSQVLLAIVFVLPIAALSTLTAGFVQLIFAILTPCVIALVVAIVAPEVVLGGFSGGTDWVRTYCLFLVISVAAPAILVWQYSTRRTAAGRVLAVAAAVLAVLGMTLIPWSAAFKIQSWLSKQKVEQPLGRVEFDSRSKWLTRAVIEGDRIRVELPLNVTALPTGMSAKPEGFSIQLQAPDGTMWHSDQALPGYASNMGQEFSLQVTVDSAFYRKVKDKPMRVRGSLYLTVFGNRGTTFVPLGDRSVPVQRIGVCAASRGANRQSYFLICSSAFRFPPMLVSYSFIQSAKETSQHAWTSTQPRSISYSPFPAEPGISPISQDFTFATIREAFSEGRVDAVEALAHIRRSFEVDNLRLGDFEVRPALVSP
jgi:hypothetical protein